MKEFKESLYSRVDQNYHIKDDDYKAIRTFPGHNTAKEDNNNSTIQSLIETCDHGNTLGNTHKPLYTRLECEIDPKLELIDQEANVSSCSYCLLL